MSAIFQRPLCEMGAAYDFSLRPLIGDADPGSGGPCDDRPHPVEMFSSDAHPEAVGAPSRAFSLCPEHEQQLRSHDASLATRGIPSRFRGAPTSPEAPASARR
ncbi:MAG TPA: hypothetical protein VML94_01685 [Thermoplasmata archaeon]|nr:hypothetical protein [Thermoplasmata archaeon]